MPRLARAISSALNATLICLMLGCASDGRDEETEVAARWNGDVRVYGALRTMFHEGQTGPTVSLDTLLTGPDVYALGALADLAGEVTVVAGKAYLSYADGESIRTEASPEPSVEATLLVASRVPVWRSVVTGRSIPFDDLDDAITELAISAGFGPEERVPFLVEGVVEDLRWHVIDGSRLTAGATSRQDHLAAAVRVERSRSPATLIGFYSQSDQGVFTHMGSKTHIHCVIEEPVATGHVDHVILPAATIVKFPAGVRSLNSAAEGSGSAVD